MPELDNRTARRIFLERHGLADTPSGTGKGQDLQQLIDRLGFVQIDSINTVARAHHMILHARRPAYRPPNLHSLHDRDRGIFEHWTHDASMIPMQHFPHWKLRFRRYEAQFEHRWRRDGYDDKLDAVLRRILDEGPCCSADVGLDEARSSGGCGTGTPPKWRSNIFGASVVLPSRAAKGFARSTT